MMGPEAEKDYREIIVEGRDSAEVTQEHQRSTEIVKRNAR